MIPVELLREFRAWKQGLVGRPFMGKSACDVLEKTGWSRSVGGASPYLHFRSRAGLDRVSVDEEVKKLDIHELPSARGCVYVLPKSDFALGLALNKHPEEPVIPTSPEKQLGITTEQIQSLSDKVLALLERGEALDPKQMREALGEAVKSYGEEGKKRGITTDLPGVLGRLQAAGKIRRIPVNGRLDQERYSYEKWAESPLQNYPWSKIESFAELLKRYLNWLGPVTVDEFRWFSGAGVRDCNAAIEAAQVKEANGYLWGRGTESELSDYKPSTESDIHFIGCLDNLFLLTRNLQVHIDEKDRGMEIFSEKKSTSAGGLSDLANHAIVDRGRLIGLWDYDFDAKELVWKAWAGEKDLLAALAKETEEFVREQLGDARTFSLDSPKSRQARLSFLRG
ncbi:crosslink repair DNA glycosylase YcaQ family protein [Kamptonema cortianum]|nr:crosslink repair DNA glycosylase YcaQ family protein [Geitlerinema splendidum]MDK3158526.1 crosslink repair DNA glycosylase YcaQ family protein [Kamptonema cortianum]